MKILTRLPILFATVLVISLLSFLLVELAPGDPVQAIAGEEVIVDEIERARLEKELGLDDPVFVRFGSYLADVAQGDFGNSVKIQVGKPVLTVIGESLPVTLSLLVFTFFIIFVLALPLGYLAARNPGSLVDRGVTLLSSVFLSVPPFVTGLVLVILLSLELGWLPAIGYQPLSAGVLEWAKHLLLPSLALATTSTAELTRQVRGALVDTFEQDYIRTARAKGMSSRVVIWKHALKNAAPPVITVSGLQLTRLIGGTIIVERIFAMTGIGSLSYNAVIGRDFTVLQGLVLFSGVAVIVINLLIDLANLAVSPRQRV